MQFIRNQSIDPVRVNDGIMCKTLVEHKMRMSKNDCEEYDCLVVSS